MAKYNNHHISYEPEVVVSVQQSWHRVVSRIQNTKATPTFYADLTNFVHSVVEEWNRVRKELETGLDLRVKR